MACTRNNVSHYSFSALLHRNIPRHARRVISYHFGGYESSRWSLVVGVAGNRKFGLAWLREESARQNLETMLGSMTRVAVESSPTTGTSLSRARARD